MRVGFAPDGSDGSVTIHQDARIHAGLFDGTERASLALAAGRSAYAHLVRGKLTVNGTPLEAGDALKMTGISEVVLEKGEKAEVLLFDLP